MSLDEQIKGKSKEDRIKLKSSAIVKQLKKGKEKTKGLNIEIVDFQEIEGGVQVLVRAFRGKKQIGFGKDGTVDIERFRIFNPPVLVDDPSGNIVRVTEANEELGVPRSERRLREDPKKALIESLAHTIEQVGKEGKIQRGKVGNTTSTFYSDAGTGSTTVDGQINRAATGAWSLLRNNDGTIVAASGTTTVLGYLRATANTNEYNLMIRGMFTFDTSSIPDGDDIHSVYFSTYCTTATNTSAFGGLSVGIASWSLVANNNLQNSDYNITNMGSQVTSSKAFSSYTTSAYNDHTFTDLSAINKTGISAFAALTTAEINNVEPTWEFATSTIIVNTADQAGTANDPKLVVEHEAPAVDTSKFFMLF